MKTMGWIKKTYLYLVSLISLVIIVVGAIMLINLGLKQWVFPKAGEYYTYPVTCPATTPTGDTKGQACDPALQKQQQEADAQNKAASKQQQAAQAIAMILVASPVFYYHWRLARKET